MSVGPKEHLEELTLSLLVDDLLDGQETDRCYAHMEQCSDCETAFENLQAISFAMAKLEDMPVPEGFLDGVMGKLPPQDSVDASKTIEIKEHRVKKSFFANLPLGQVACFAAVAMFGLTFLQNPPVMEETITGRGLDAAPESETMTLGEGFDEDVMPSAMPMDVDGEDLRFSGEGMMGEAAGMAELLPESAFVLGEEWLLDGTSFATSWEELDLSGSPLVTLVVENVLQQGDLTPDVVFFGDEEPDLQLCSTIKDGEFTQSQQQYHYSTGMVSQTDWEDFTVLFQSEFPELGNLMPLEEEISLLFVY